MTPHRAALALLAITGTGTGCAVSPGGGAGLDETEQAASTAYVNIMDFGATDQGAYYDLVQTLDAEYAALDATHTPLTFYCSVSSKEGSVKDCAWTFAASQFGVDGKTAAIAFDVPTFQCHIHPKTTAPKLLALLEGSSDALHEVLPGTTSIYDALADCFAHPIGATPLPAPSAATTYVDASAYYATAANQAKWTAARATLVAGFDDVCGDTFCSGDFTDLASLQIACAVTKSSGNVKGCAWSFAGSYTTIASSGDLALVSRAWTCPVAVSGTLAQLIAALTATSTDDGVHRVLPGGMDAYDQIAACLP